MGTPILTIYCSHLLTERSSVVEQLAYIQCVGGSIPPVPIFRKENEKMIITGMNHFQNVAKKKLVEWYHEHKPEVEIDLSNVFVVWSCKTLQNYKCLASTDISGDGIYAEYTYNGDKQELYEDVYGKITNTCHTEE